MPSYYTNGSYIPYGYVLLFYKDLLNSGTQPTLFPIPTVQ